MTIDERLEALTMNLELQAREGEAQRQRIDALTMNLELQSREGEAQRLRIEALARLIEKDSENIRSLARIAEAHENRISRIEDDGA